jgi:hypothetical protein
MDCIKNLKSLKYLIWLFISATYFRCLLQESSPDRVKRSANALAGAPSPADVNDPYIQEIASTALAEIDGRSNALYRQKVVRIVEAQKQVHFVLSCIVAVVYSVVFMVKYL